MGTQLESMVEEQQKMLEEAGIPGFIVTRDQKVINLQQRILDLALEVESDPE